MTVRLLVTAVLAALAGPGLVRAQALPKAPEGFKVEVVLQAPEIEAPTAITVAPNGDVYFAEDPMDMGGNARAPEDRIWLLKGGDPRKKTLFAEKLWAVMGLEVVGDRLFVVNAPHVTVFDLNADGTARRRTELFTDLGPPDPTLGGFNDHIPSGIRLGMDGFLYVSIGDKGIPKMTRKEPGSVHVAEGRWRYSPTEGPAPGRLSLEGGGVIRFRPDGSRLDVFASGTRNHLDVAMDADDRVFVRDNTDDGDGWWTRFMYVIDGGFFGYPWAFTRHPDECLPRVAEFGGGSPCGGLVYCDDGLPETYRGRVFHCEWGKAAVFAVKVAPDGAGLRYVDEIKFLDPNGVPDFRPFDIAVTADGRGFYVTDWGFSGWKQNVKAGRIYKVTYERDDVAPAPRWQRAETVEALLRLLNHPAFTERLRLQRLLEDRLRAADERARADTLRAVAAAFTDPAGSPARQKHLLWALANGGCPNQATVLAKMALDPKYRHGVGASPEVRAQAAKLLGVTNQPGALLKALADPAPPVRLQAAIGLGHCDMTVEETIDTAETVARQKTDDPYLRHALAHTLRRLDRSKIVIAKVLGLKGSPTTEEVVLQALADDYNPQSVAFLRAHWSQIKDYRLRREVIAILARMHHDRKPYTGGWWGTQPERLPLPPRVVAWEGTPHVKAVLVAALDDVDRVTRQRAVAGLVALKDPETAGVLQKQFAKEMNVDSRADIVRALGLLKQPEAGGFLAGVLRDDKAPAALRVEAVTALERLGTAEAAEAIARATEGGPAVEVLARSLDALAALKAPAAKGRCQAALAHDDPAARKAAVAALGKLGDASAVGLVLPLLDDGDLTVRVAAIDVLGGLRAREAVPRLLVAAGREPTRFEATRALARIPDLRALPAYLEGLVAKSPELRTACATAIGSIREEAAAELDRLAKAGQLPPAAVAELRKVYSTFQPVLTWKLIGPFPYDGKSHPPEEEQKFEATYLGCDDQKVRWREVAADPRHGLVNPAAAFQPNQNTVAYGYAEITSPAARDTQLQVGSDDSIVIWLNGKKVHEYPGDRGWAPNQDLVAVRLEAGVNRLLVKCGNHGGPWGFSVAVAAALDRYAFLAEPAAAPKLTPEDYRAFALGHPGDPENGRRLFMDLKGVGCVKCHRVAGQGEGQVGPDLGGIALKYKRDEIVTSVLEPSKNIAQGYETVLIVTKSGQVLSGVFRGEVGDVIQLGDTEGKIVSVPKKDVDEKAVQSKSTMPDNLHAGLTPQEFTDLIEFLARQKDDKFPPPPVKKD
jgi:putative membrane-bound dehydrogenase-like protein